MASAGGFNPTGLVSTLQALTQIVAQNSAIIVGELTPSSSPPSLVYVEGGATPGDGGGGFYYAVPSDTISPDNGSTIIVNRTGLRYYLIPSQLTESGPGVFTNTQFNLFASFILNGLSPSYEWVLVHPGQNATQALVAGIAIPSTSTVFEADAGYFYTTNLASATVAVACGFSARALAANTFNFAQNWIINDSGFAGCNMVGCEVDVSVTGVGSAIYCFDFIGGFPNPVATSVGFIFNTTGKPWSSVLQSSDGASTSNAILLGALSTPAATVDSQGIVFGAYDSTATSQACLIAAQATSNGANLVLTPSATGSLITPNALGVFGLGAFASALQVTGNGGFFATFEVSASIIGSITYTGSTTSYNTTSDYRIKTVYGPANGSKLREMQVHEISYKDDPTQARHFAFLAHEVQQVVPAAVTGIKDAVYAADVIATRPKKVHSKGEPRAEDVTRQERVIDRVVSAVYENNVVNQADGSILHKKGDPYERKIWKTNTIVVHAKGTPYEADVLEAEEAVVHKKGDPVLQQMDHSLLVPYIVAHSLEMDAREAALEAREAALEARVAAMEARLAAITPH